jgi:hypothetical protein
MPIGPQPVAKEVFARSVDVNVNALHNVRNRIAIKVRALRWNKPDEFLIFGAATTRYQAYLAIPRTAQNRLVYSVRQIVRKRGKFRVIDSRDYQLAVYWIGLRQHKVFEEHGAS